MPRIRMLKRTVANKTEVKVGDEINVSQNEANLLVGTKSAEFIDGNAPTVMKTASAADLVNPDPEVTHRDPHSAAAGKSRKAPVKKAAPKGK